MILEFCITNYLSIKEEQKISFIATSLKENTIEPNMLFKVGDTELSLLRSAVIYGANASGKSNVLKALAFYKKFISDSFKNSQAGEVIDVETFRLNSNTASEPATMEATFTDGVFIYRYGFEVSSESVEEEWLYKRACKKRAKEVELFYRTLMYNILLTRQKQAIDNAEAVLSGIAHGNPAKEESSTTVQKLVIELNKFL